MKLKYLIRMSCDNALSGLIKFLYSTILYIAALGLISLIVLLGVIQLRVRNNLDKAFYGGVENTGYIIFTMRNGDDPFETNNLIKVASELDCIKGFASDWEMGSMDVGGEWSIKDNEREYTSSNLDFLREIQKNHRYNNNINYGMSDESEYSLDRMFFYNYSWDMFNISLYAGKTPDMLDSSYTELLYMGYEYRDVVSPGTVISNGEKTYLVAGILDKGAVLPVDEYMLTEGITTDMVDSVYVMDYVILNITNEMPKHLWEDSAFFVVGDGYTFEEARDMIIQSFDEIGADANVSQISKWIDGVYAKRNKQCYVELLIMIIIISCLILVCFQINNIMSRRKDYGVYFASGISHSDIIKMAVIENVIKIFVAVLIVLGVISLYVTRLMALNMASLYMVKNVLYMRLAIILTSVSVFLIVIESVLPAIIIKKLSPIELIGGK